MFQRSLKISTLNKNEHFTYSRRAILRRVTYLLMLVSALQTIKLFFLPDTHTANIDLHVANAFVHLLGFSFCVYAFQRKYSVLAKWLLQICFISFITSAGYLWQEDIALQYFYLLALFITGFMYSDRETTLFILFCGLYVGLFLLFQHVYSATTSGTSYAYLTMVNSVVLAFSCLGCAWIVRKMTLLNWHEAQNLTQSQSTVIHNVFPERIAGKLISVHRSRKSSDQDLMYKASMSVVFIDIVNSTGYMKKVGDKVAFELINRLFAEFDDDIRKSCCLRIKTNGDQYIFVCELTNGEHEAGVCHSLDLVRDLYLIFQRLAVNTSMALRCGVSTGEIAAGVINLKSPSFDVWGQSVVLASRLEKSCAPMHVHCDQQTYELAQARFSFCAPAIWNFKGLGKTRTYQMSFFQ